jgi:hypothetical protein
VSPYDAAANGNLARKAKVSSINACAGLSRRRQVTLKKINLGINKPKADCHAFTGQK